MTIRNAYEQYVKSLSSIYEASEAESIAQIMFEERVGLKKSDLILRGNETMSEVKANDLTWKLLRLMKGEPMQYVLGYCYWFGMKFKVNKHVLIPRPETEELVEWVITESRNKTSSKVLDIGTGSGCIAIALKKNIPFAEVSALDVSEEVLKVARENAQQNQVEVNFIQDDILNPKSEVGDPQSENSPLTTHYSLLISNPPYILESEKPSLHKNVLDFEPHDALFVPDHDPLIFYKAIIKFAKDQLSSDGEIFFEVNSALADDVVEELQSNDFLRTQTRNDLSGKTRMVRGKRQ